MGRAKVYTHIGTPYRLGLLSPYTIPYKPQALNPKSGKPEVL